MTFVSPYLREAPRPVPAHLPNDRVMTTLGMGTVKKVHWSVPPNEAPHWRWLVLLDHGFHIDCGSVKSMIEGAA